MNKVGVYFHLPFCKRRCLYCDFYSTSALSRMEDYVRALCRHIREAKELFPPLCTDTVYFGGGTPSLLPPEAIGSLLEALHAAFPLTGEVQITLEANPATVDEQKLRAYRAMGIDRISLGIQSTCDRELAAIGRLHTAKEALETASLIEKLGFPHFSADLMYALPYQTEESFRASLRDIACCGADHISAYCLTLSEEVPLAGSSFPQASENEQQQMYLNCCSYLEQQGFYRYEISNFARPGCESRHNLKYWKRLPTLAFGAGAYSFFDDRRWSLKADLEQVISSPLEQLITEKERLSREDILTETLMLSLRLREGLRYESLRPLCSGEVFDALTEKIRSKLALWESLELISSSPHGFALTHKGAFVSNTILADLI